jgi:L-2-hydroxyglutarate oxidase
MKTKTDYVIVGGGLVGLAVAYQILLKRPGSSVVLLEKEDAPAKHQSTRNSGVIHTGIYYKPNSFKARLCAAGRRSILEFAQAHNISHSICGKLIVASDKGELERLGALRSKADSNRVEAYDVPAEGLQEYEPHVAGVGGIWVPGAGVIDFAGVASALVREIQRLGGEVRLRAPLTGATRSAGTWHVRSEQDEFQSSFVINCAGLHSDRVAEIFGTKPSGRIIPFRGEYYLLTEEARRLCRTLIYPVPDPRFPFLGVHFTKRFDGSVECGPNAVLAFAREGYGWGTVSLNDLAQMFGFPGFRKLCVNHWRMGAAETYRSLFKHAFVRSLQKLIPSVQDSDLLPAGAGVRAQVVRPDGSLEDDFAFGEGPGVLHVLNAPSPAATSCLAIGAEISCRALGETTQIAAP